MADVHVPVDVDGKRYYIILKDVTPPAAAVNLLPAALTQAELEALKPGPLPEGGMCEKCRLRPPFGYRNDSGELFYCKRCYLAMNPKA